MANLATPNLPSSDFSATAAFYGALGFERSYEDDGWMILVGHGMTLEFFGFPDMDPATSSFSCCLRVDAVDDFVDRCRQAGVPDTTQGWPRFHPARLDASGLRIGALIDPDGTLLRLVQNP